MEAFNLGRERDDCLFEGGPNRVVSGFCNHIGSRSDQMRANHK